MTDTERNGWDRDADLALIQATYAAYAREGRFARWNPANRGFLRTAMESRREIKDLLRASISSPESLVVDVGCGPGHLFAEVSRAGIRCRWLGVDLRPQVIAEASQAYPEAEFVVASADQMPLESGTVDAALAVVMFSSLPSAALEGSVARDIRRILKPGGYLIWFDLRYSDPRNPRVHGLTIARVGELFPGWGIDLKTTSLLAPMARLLGPTTPILYPILKALPALRSHLVGRLQRPSDVDG